MYIFNSVCIFIIMCILIYFFNTSIYYFSSTSLGKIVAILIIISMAKIRPIFGFLAFLVLLVYYKVFVYYNVDAIKIDYLKGIDSIYWINLDRSIERRRSMELMLQDPVFQEIPIQRIAGFDGKYQDPMQYFQLKTKKNTNIEYSCLLSHLNAIRAFSKTNNMNALIFEDDVTLEFRKYWMHRVQHVIDNAPKGWEIIQLCYNTRSTLTDLYTLNNYKNYNGYGNIACMAAYIINKPAADNFMKQTYNNATNKYLLQDYNTHEADHYIFKCLKTYTYKYPYFIYPTENNSTLHEQDLASHIRSKMKLENMYKQIYS